MKFACGIVLYKPSLENIKHMKMIFSQFENILIYENSNYEYQNYFEENENVTYICTGKNNGLAAAYNCFLILSRKLGIDILCLLDQDSMMTVDNIIKMKNFIARNNSENIVVFAPRLRGTRGKNWVINSNSFLNIHAVNENALKYDEAYFLDRLDADFCKQIIDKGLRIKCNEELLVEHRIGYGKNNEHSAVRHYYMFRNRIYFNYKFYSKLKAAGLTLLQSFKHLASIILFETDRKNKIAACLDGIRDYKRMGKKDAS